MKLFALLALASQQAGKAPDFLQSDKLGVAINRPPKPKNEDWDLKTDGGFLRSSQLVVKNNKEKLWVEISAKDLPGGGLQGLMLSVWDPQGTVVNLWKSIADNPNFKDARLKNDPKRQSKLPGNGGGGAPCFYVDVSFKDKDGTPTSLVSYCFVGKENNNLYHVMVVGEEKAYQKHNQEIQYILATIRTFKPKPK